ncbi:MAG: glycosyltransferase family 4 protein [Bdellovibrionota bacterium]
MSPLALVAFAGAACLLAFALTKLVRGYVLKRNILDIPNERSSHKTPTPRGGGLAVAITFTAFAFVSLAELGRESTWLAVVAMAAVISAVGWWDDKRGLSAGIRLAFQFSASLVVLLVLEDRFGLVRANSFEFVGFLIPAFIAFPAIVLFLVWMTNLYNFMDGIDGILGLQTVTVAIPASLLLILNSSGPTPLAVAYVILAGSAVGFLFLNWSPAKIFMGDVGSAFTGFLLGVFAVVGAEQAELSFTSAVILNSAFIWDATITLFVRLSRRKKPHQAHRSHFYQKMVLSGASHARVSSLFGAVNVLWLFPLAYANEANLMPPSIALVLAALPAIHLALRYKAGVDAS